MQLRVLPPEPKGPFTAAIKILQARGRDIRPSNIPGLTTVDGQEMTMNQVIDVASRD